MGLVGQVLDGQYRIDEFVGEGGFSVVYRGFHIGLGEIVAIKCLKLQTSLQLGSAIVESFVRRFRDEGRILYRLSQGNLHIVRSIASGTTIAPTTGSLVPYTVLEWLEGHSLAQDFDRRRAAAMRGRAPHEAAVLFSTAFEAVAYAHEQGVIHRDLNPGNIFLTQTREGVRAKVLDFGVAKIVSDHALELGPRAATIGQLRMFSPAYAAPEQFDEKLGKPGPFTDVYTLAIVFVEALRDQPAIEGENIATLVGQTLDANRRPTPRTLGIDVPDELEKVFVRALSIAPENRPQNAAQLWAEIAAALKIRNIALPSPSQLMKTPPPSTSAPVRPTFGAQTVRMVSPLSTNEPNPPGADPRALATTVAASGLVAARQPSGSDGAFSATMMAPEAALLQPANPPPQTVPLQNALNPNASGWAGNGKNEPSAPQIFQVAPPQQQQQTYPQQMPPPIVAVARDGGGAASGFNDATGVINVAQSKAPLLIFLGVIVVVISVSAFLFRGRLHLQSIPAASASVISISPSASVMPAMTAQPSSTIAPQPPMTASAEPIPSASAAPSATAAATETATATTTATNDAPHASASAVPKPTATPIDPNAFDAAAAQHSLGTSDSILASCTDAKGQKGVAHVTFGNDGAVQKVVLDAPLGGTPGGDCVASRYKFAHAPKFLGPPATVDHPFHVPK
jgi:serine/threonine-protein kinase